MKKFIIKSGIFILVFCIFLSIIEILLVPMDIAKTAIFTALKSKDSVYIVGSSHVYWDYDPFEIEKISGLKTSIVGSSSQTFEESYFIIKKLIKKPETKIIFLETYMIQDSENKNIKDGSFSLVFDYFNFLDRAEVVKYYLGEYKLQYIFNFYKYHNNWKSIDILLDNIKNKKEFSWRIKFSRGYHPFKGFIPHENRNPDLEEKGYKKIPNNYFDKNLKVDKEKKINPQYEKLLNDLFKLCEENRVKLILVTSPFYFQNQSAEDISLYSNYLVKIAKKNNSDLINFNYLYEELKIDKTHFKDSGHLNKYGAKIMGNFIGNYLKQIT